MRDRAAQAALVFSLAIIASVIGANPAVADGEVDIETMANGQVANSAPGPTVQSGATVSLSYLITVGSAVPLFDFIVTNETDGTSPDCDIDGDGQPDGTNGHPGPLSGGQSFVCVASVVAGEAGLTFSSIGAVRAFDFDITNTFSDADAAHYTTVAPPTTRPPTTAAPTAPPTTAPSTVPSTAAPTTPTSLTLSTSSTVATSSATSSTIATSSTATSTSSTTADKRPSPTTDGSSTSPDDVDDVAIDELAATPDDTDGGFPWLWVVLAFSAGGAVAAIAARRLSAQNATVPDQTIRD